MTEGVARGDEHQHPGAPEPRSGPLRELAWLFVKLGATAFGGPAVHIAMMEDEVVRRRGWLTRERFLDLLGATNLIPGPNSTEIAIHIGHQRAGWLGLLVAGACFIVPAALITLALAWAYVRFGSRPEGEALLYGVKPVIIAVVVQALLGLARTAVKTGLLGVLGVAAVVASLAGMSELVLLLVIGAATAIARGARRTGGGTLRCFGASAAITAVSAGASATAAVAAPFSLAALFLVFLKIGAILYGSGYVLMAFLHADLVEQRGWLTDAQLLDAIAIGQMTPGPLSTTATFVGYLLGGVAGGLVATAGIFLPSFAFVAISGPLIPRLRRSATAGAFLDGVNVASLGLMAAVTFQLVRAAIVDGPTLAIALTSAILVFRYRVSSAWLVFAGGAAGIAVVSAGWRH